jgi:four helix bundle protein
VIESDWANYRAFLIGAVRAVWIAMTPEDLRNRTRKFAVDAVRFCRNLPKDAITQEMALQLVDAATSVAANYRAVCRARSRADFINKLGVAIEESDESALWLEVLEQSETAPPAQTRPLHAEAESLTKILVRSRETARANRERSSRNRQSGMTNHQFIHHSPIKDRK